MALYINPVKNRIIAKQNAKKRGEHLQPGALNARVRCPCGTIPTIHPTGLCKECAK